MGDDTSNTMNLDLNLSPVVPPWPDNTSGSRPVSRGPLNLEEWINGGADRLREEWLNAGADRLREAVWPSTRRRWSPRQRWQSWRLVPVHLDARNIALDLMDNSSSGGGNSGILQSGEGSVTAEERDTVLTKTCKNNAVDSEEGALGKKEDTEKGCGDEGSFFDCNICLDLARDPVVTCCGHLFCWPCLYRWLHVHSDAKECPVCKGEVKIRNVIPIYGRGNDARDLEGDSSLKIPLRPHAQRIESFRQTIQRNAVPIPVEEMIQHLGSRLDLARDLVQSQPPNTSSANESLERNLSLLNQMLTSRRMPREHSVAMPLDDIVDLTHNSPTNSEMGESRLSSLLLQRLYLRRAATISNPTSPLSPAERLVDSDFNNHPVERNQQQPPLVEDRDFIDRLLVSSFSNYPVERNLEHLLPPDANRDFANRLFESAFFSYSAARNHEQPTPVDDGDFAERLLASYFHDHPEERNQEQPPPLNDRDSADRFLASYFHNHPVERNQEHPVDDRDSVSSMPAVIQSESQTLDTATDIDSNVALSTSLSRRRNDTLRVSDRDSGDSRASRRRRLT